MFRTAHIVLLLLLTWIGSNIQAQTNLRVQNKSPEWMVIESDHFNFYFADSSVELAKLIMPLAVDKLTGIEERIGYRLSGRINVYVHRSVAALNNTYAMQHDDHGLIAGGVTDVRNNDLHVFNSGDISALANQLTIGIADNLLVEMLYGGTVQERIKYAALLNLPVWFREGLIRYMALGWDTDSDNLLRDAFNNQQFKSFNQLTKEQQSLVGQSMWLYINDVKKKDAIQRILYLVRLTRKVETALYYVLNQTSKELYTEWFYANQAVYANELTRRIPQRPENEPIDPGKTKFFGTALSPNATYIATAYRDDGQAVIDIYNRDTRNQVSYHFPFEFYPGFQTDYQEILLTFKDQETILVVDNQPTPTLFELKVNGTIHGPIHKLEDFDLVTGIDYSTRSHEVVVSAVQMGSSHIYVTKDRETWTQLTDTVHDDRNPHFDATANIYFTRVVPKHTTEEYVHDWQRDIFYMFRSGKTVLSTTNVTNTPDLNETQPKKLNSKYLSFLSDRNGIQNAYAYKLDQQTFALSNYQTGIIQHDINQERTHIIESVIHNGRLYTHVSAIDSSENFGAILYPSKTKVLIHAAERIKRASEEIEVLADSLANEDQQKVYFQSAFPIPDNIDSLEAIREQTRKRIDYTFKKIGKKSINMRPSSISTQLNNSNFLTDEFASRFDPMEQMRNRFGLALGMTMNDRLKNHVIQGQMRTSFNFRLFQYNVSYTNFLGKFTETVSFKAEQNRFNQNTESGNRVMRMIDTKLQRKLNHGFTIRFNQKTRFDRYSSVFLDEASLVQPDITQWSLDQIAGIKYSNVVSVNEVLNKGLSVDFQATYRNALDRGSSIINNLKIEYGRRVSKNIVWQNRFFAGVSSGSANNVFVLGGNRNQYLPQIGSQRTLVENSAFFQPVYGVRNLNINTRSGNTFSFINSEIWLPLNIYLGKKPLKNSILQHLWVVGFADAGSAWYGKSPSDRANITNVSYVNNGRLEIEVFNARNPIVSSFGGGLRTKVFGYLLRYDLAWTNDNDVWNRAVSRISIGKAF